MFCHVAPRPRNAEATRAAILEAARERFARDSYDDVGMRDIARDVGVDAALVSRYFGSKEDLFTAVLDSCENGADLMPATAPPSAGASRRKPSSRPRARASSRAC